MFVYLFANPSETAYVQRAEILRDDFPWVADGFQKKHFRIRRTIRRKIKITRAFMVETSDQLPLPFSL